MHFNVHQELCNLGVHKDDEGRWVNVLICTLKDNDTATLTLHLKCGSYGNIGYGVLSTGIQN